MRTYKCELPRGFVKFSGEGEEEGFREYEHELRLLLQLNHLGRFYKEAPPKPTIPDGLESLEEAVKYDTADEDEDGLSAYGESVDDEDDADALVKALELSQVKEGGSKGGSSVSSGTRSKVKGSEEQQARLMVEAVRNVKKFKRAGS